MPIGRAWTGGPISRPPVVRVPATDLRRKVPRSGQRTGRGAAVEGPQRAPYPGRSAPEGRTVGSAGVWPRPGSGPGRRGHPGALARLRSARPAPLNSPWPSPPPIRPSGRPSHIRHHSPRAVEEPMQIDDQGFVCPVLGLRPRGIRLLRQAVAPWTGSGHPGHERPVVFAMIGPWERRDALTRMSEDPIGLTTVGTHGTRTRIE